MVRDAQPNLLVGTASWLERERTVQAAVLFGSHARAPGAPAAADGWSDIDLQVVTTAPERILAADWNSIAAGQLCLRVLRPATSGVRKLTLLYAEGEIDLVIVPAWQLRVARFALAVGLHTRIGRVKDSLNNLSTIMGGGYRLLKGERSWGPFYARVVSELPGFRLSDEEILTMADSFLCDLHWVLQKLRRGELVAAQRILHRSMLETNIVLRHEAQCRAQAATFQQARRVEKLLSTEKLRTVQVSARLEYGELLRAAWSALAGLEIIMHELVPEWRVTPEAETLLAPWKLRDGAASQD